MLQVKAKGQRKIGLPEFKEAIDIIAAKKGVSADDIIAKLSNTDGPSVNATQAEPNKFHDDKNLYTGAPQDARTCHIATWQSTCEFCVASAIDLHVCGHIGTIGQPCALAQACVHSEFLTNDAGVYKNGGPTNVDNPKDLSGICDRTAADVRGVKKTISATTSGLTAAERRPSGVQ